MGTHDRAVVGGGKSEALKAAVPVDWLDEGCDHVALDTSLPPGTVLDSAPMVLIDIDPKSPAFVKIRVNGRDGLVRPDRLEKALPNWNSIPHAA
jgi:hypothetical protein